MTKTYANSVDKVWAAALWAARNTGKLEIKFIDGSTKTIGLERGQWWASRKPFQYLVIASGTDGAVTVHVDEDIRVKWPQGMRKKGRKEMEEYLRNLSARLGESSQE